MLYKAKRIIMINQFENIRQLISSYIDISEVEWKVFSSLLRVKDISKKSIILNQNSYCRHLYFVNSGLLRVYFTDNEGVEKSFHFSLKNTFATDYESFLKQLPSNYSIQALEDSQVVVISLEALQAGIEKLKNGEKLGRLLLEDYFFIFSDKIQDIYTQTPIERYNKLINKFPTLLQRVPQHYIASYLNISPVHLSRLKSAYK